MRQTYCPTCEKVMHPRVVMVKETAAFKGCLVVFDRKEYYCPICEQQCWHEKSREHDYISMQAEHDRQKQTASTYTITLIGCDDETEITMPLTYEEILLVRRIAEKVEERSSYDCMPVMSITYKDDVEEGEKNGEIG